MENTYESITKVWNEFSPYQSMRISFLKDQIAEMNKEVVRMGQIFSVFAILAITIACMGLFALSTYIVEQRSKEISVRKVLGASIVSIFKLLTFSFIRLVLLALVIAIPIAMYLGQEWLNDFEYKINMTWWVFVVSGILIVAIAIITISKQALKVSFANPIDYLRNE